jgi:hypothetical protein
MNSIRSSSFLRRVLLVDAASCAGMGLGMIAFTELFARVLELPAQLLSEAGLVLLPFAAFLAFVASRPTPARFAVWAIIVLNVIWVVDSIVLLFTDWVAPNALGYAFVIAQAVVVAVLADLEYVGLKKSASYGPAPKTS